MLACSQNFRHLLRAILSFCDKFYCLLNLLPANKFLDDSVFDSECCNLLQKVVNMALGRCFCIFEKDCCGDVSIHIVSPLHLRGDNKLVSWSLHNDAQLKILGVTNDKFLCFGKCKWSNVYKILIEASRLFFKTVCFSLKYLQCNNAWGSYSIKPNTNWLAKLA